MKQVRKGVFETNSSSTHAICIAQENTFPSLPVKLQFGFDEFGWEENTLFAPIDKANYLYTGICEYYSESEEERTKVLDFIRDTLAEYGVTAYFKKPKFRKFISEDRQYSIFESGCIDHSGELADFLNAVLSDKLILISYLFSDRSYVETGNDNSSHNVTIDADYPHWEFYKWN